MKKAFTLLELLVVMGIMGALAVMSLNSYRALTRGMEDRTAISAAQSFIDLVSQRAEIDRTQVEVHFYDEMRQLESDDGTRSMNGHGVAYAIKPSGRVTGFDTSNGAELICDEFGDLDQAIASLAATGTKSKSSSSKKSLGMRLYLMGQGGKHFDVSTDIAVCAPEEPYIVSGQSVGGRRADGSQAGGGGEVKAIRVCAFRKISGDTPKLGDTYGTEFARLDLPNGYFFSSSPPRRAGETREAKSPVVVSASGTGLSDIQVYRYGQNSAVGTAKGRN